MLTLISQLSSLLLYLRLSRYLKPFTNVKGALAMAAFTLLFILLRGIYYSGSG